MMSAGIAVFEELHVGQEFVAFDDHILWVIVLVAKGRRGEIM